MSRFFLVHCVNAHIDELIQFFPMKILNMKNHVKYFINYVHATFYT